MPDLFCQFFTKFLDFWIFLLCGWLTRAIAMPVQLRAREQVWFCPELIITLWHKIITYEKFFEIIIFGKLRISRVIPWKCLSFLDILRAQNPSKITKNNSQGIIFVIISCQRVEKCRYSTMWNSQRTDEALWTIPATSPSFGGINYSLQLQNWAFLNTQRSNPESGSKSILSTVAASNPGEVGGKSLALRNPCAPNRLIVYQPQNSKVCQNRVRK